jgi:hypothetical protein
MTTFFKASATLSLSRYSEKENPTHMGLVISSTPVNGPLPYLGPFMTAALEPTALEIATSLLQYMSSTRTRPELVATDSRAAIEGLMTILKDITGLKAYYYPPPSEEETAAATKFGGSL